MPDDKKMNKLDTYRAHTTGDDAVKRKSLGNAMGHAAAARADGIMN
jgi:hypothetical protein